LRGPLLFPPSLGPTSLGSRRHEPTAMSDPAVQKRRRVETETRIPPAWLLSRPACSRNLIAHHQKCRKPTEQRTGQRCLQVLNEASAMYVRELHREQQRRDVEHDIRERHPESRRIALQVHLPQDRSKWFCDDQRNDGAEAKANENGKS